MNINEYKYKIETHAHTSPMSPCADFSAEDVIKLYAEAGFNAVAITNHFCSYSFQGDDFKMVKKRFLNDFYNAQNTAQKYGINAILGMEIRFCENSNDYLLYGFDEDDIKSLFKATSNDYKTFFKEKDEKMLFIQAHPFRNNMTETDPTFLDGIETLNMHPGHNGRLALAIQYAKKHPHLITTCGTDFHHAGHQGLGGILSKTLPKDAHEFVKLLRSRDYLFNLAGNVVIP